MSRITAEFELSMPDGQSVLIDASGDIFQDMDRLWLEDVSFDAYLFTSSDDLEGRKLADQEIQVMDRRFDLEGTIDDKLYSRFEQLRDEGPEWKGTQDDDQPTPAKKFNGRGLQRNSRSEVTTVRRQYTFDLRVHLQVDRGPRQRFHFPKAHSGHAPNQGSTGDENRLADLRARLRSRGST